MEFNILISAFAGAFFAFLFARLAEFLTKLYQREVQHYNSLVTLGNELNEYIGVIRDDIFVIDNFIQAITTGKIYFVKLQTLPINKDHYSSLYSLDLLNDLFSLYYLVRKLNDDMNSLNTGYFEIKSAFTDGKISKADYILNANIAADNLRSIKAFLGNLEEDTLALLAKTRIAMRKDKPLGSKMQQFFIRFEGKIADVDIKKELRQLNKELTETSKKSREQIEKTVKKHNLKR